MMMCRRSFALQMACVKEGRNSFCHTPHQRFVSFQTAVKVQLNHPILPLFPQLFHNCLTIFCTVLNFLQQIPLQLDDDGACLKLVLRKFILELLNNFQEKLQSTEINTNSFALWLFFHLKKMTFIEQHHMVGFFHSFFSSSCSYFIMVTFTIQIL